VLSLWVPFPQLVAWVYAGRAKRLEDAWLVRASGTDYFLSTSAVPFGTAHSHRYFSNHKI
jgi:hypothetical protein